MPIVGTLPSDPLLDLIALPGDVVANLTEDEADLVADQIRMYQAELESLLGRAVTKRTHVQEAAWPMTAERYLLFGGPITSVTSVTVAGSTVNSTDYTVHRDSVELMTWLATPGRLVVTYEGGWDSPRNLPARSAVIGRTKRWWNKRADDDEGTESSSVEGHAVKWMDDAFTPAELAACSRLRSPDMVG